MQTLDWIMLGLFFLTLIVIGVITTWQVHRSKDYFVGGGKLPWWMGGISHHVGGYSAVIFTAWAMYAYRDGFSLYIWWALGFAVCCIVGAYLVAPRWAELRQKQNVQSPTEYLAMRYNVATQQVIVWSGVGLKLLDLAGKTIAMATILYGFAGVDLKWGILITGVVGLIYNTLGGFVASTRNDVFQFLVQLTGGILMFVFVLLALQNQHGVTYFTMWDKLDPHQFWFLRDECNLFFAIGFGLAIFFGCTGGNWGAGLRFLAAPTPRHATKSALLSGMLYLIWPLIIFAPMWAAPLLYPNLPQSEMNSVYTMLARDFLPTGLVGVILASMFAASISTIAGDCNAVSSVIARDIAPRFSTKVVDADGQTPMWFARTVAFVFTSATILIALYGDMFGGIVGLVVKWFSGLLGPISVPLVLGLLPQFDRCGPTAAISSVLVGIAAFFCMEFTHAPLSYSLFWPVISSLIVFFTFALLTPRNR
ncbi:MAG: Na+:solute symporter [Planctomycetia bacterium]|nr:Na+:solute symporter [Planctomycetia bacterium]